MKRLLILPTIGPASEVHLPLSERPQLATGLARMTASASHGWRSARQRRRDRTQDTRRLECNRLRLLGELERGMPVSVTDNWSRELTIMTKAGDFGGSETLLHCRQFLHSANPTLSPAGEKSIR